jgi:hypothetical protein
MTCWDDERMSCGLTLIDFVVSEKVKPCGFESLVGG